MRAPLFSLRRPLSHLTVWRRNVDGFIYYFLRSVFFLSLRRCAICRVDLNELSNKFRITPNTRPCSDCSHGVNGHGSIWQREIIMILSGWFAYTWRAFRIEIVANNMKAIPHAHLCDTVDWIINNKKKKASQWRTANSTLNFIESHNYGNLVLRKLFSAQTSLRLRFSTIVRIVNRERKLIRQSPSEVNLYFIFYFFLASNNRGIAYKKIRQRHHKRATTRSITFECFVFISVIVYRYVRNVFTFTLSRTLLNIRWEKCYSRLMNFQHSIDTHHSHHKYRCHLHIFFGYFCSKIHSQIFHQLNTITNAFYQI